MDTRLTRLDLAQAVELVVKTFSPARIAHICWPCDEWINPTWIVVAVVIEQPVIRPHHAWVTRALWNSATLFNIVSLHYFLYVLALL